MSEPDEFRINWFNVVGSALGAVSAAVLLSTLGAVGTIVGAALSSLCITVGGAFYAHSMRVTQARLAATPRVSERGKGLVRGAAGSTRGEPAVNEGVARQPRLQTLRELPWKRLCLTAAGLFVLAMGLIVAFELSTGRPVSSYTGGSSDTRTGTSVPGVGGGSGSSADIETPSPAVSEQGPASRPSPDEQLDPSPAPVEPSPAPSESVQSPAVPSLQSPLPS